MCKRDTNCERAEASSVKKEERSAIIISASSDIGTAMSRRWLARGWNVFGTEKMSLIGKIVAPLI